MKKQTKADKAFIEKVKSIQITASKSPQAPPCPDCGKPMSLLTVEISVDRAGKVTNEEQSFAV